MDDVTARSMRTAADDMQQAARNFDGTVERLRMVLNQFSEDMASILHRLEILASEGKK